MKFLMLLFAVALVAAGIKYRTQIHEQFLQFTSQSAPTESVEIEVHVEPEPEPKLEPLPEPEVDELEAALEAAMAREDTPQEDTPAEVVQPPLPSVSDEDFADEFPLPEFEPIEEIVGHWKEIPKSVFPRKITLKKPVTLSLPGGVGKSKAGVGSQVFAIAANGSGLLAVSVSKGSKVRGKVKMEDTDFKVVTTMVYENYKARRTQSVLAKRSAARRSALAESPSDLASNYDGFGEMPETDGSGRVRAMVDSIAKNDVTEFDLKMIKEWTPVLFDEIEGEPYWTATVKYDAKTVYGTFDAEAMALMKEGKVEKWVYAGSGEPVP